MGEQWLIDGEQLFEFLSEQLVKESGAFSKGVNKGLNIARSAVRNPDAVKPIDPETLPIVRQLRAELARVTAERDEVYCLPVKPGDKVYQQNGVDVYELEVKKIIFDCGHIAFDESAIGSSIYLSEEAAKAALDKHVEA